jgi:hypothetical protein
MVIEAMTFPDLMNTKNISICNDYLYNSAYYNYENISVIKRALSNFILSSKNIAFENDK